MIANARRYCEEQRARADLETLIDTSPVGVAVFDAATGVPRSLNRRMTVIVPDRGRFEAFEDSLDAALLDRIIDSLGYRYVALELPRFELRCGSGWEDPPGPWGCPTPSTAPPPTAPAWTAGRVLA